jgi:hypothetical protein
MRSAGRAKPSYLPAVVELPRLDSGHPSNKNGGHDGEHLSRLVTVHNRSGLLALFPGPVGPFLARDEDVLVRELSNREAGLLNFRW